MSLAKQIATANLKFAQSQSQADNNNSPLTNTKSAVAPNSAGLTHATAAATNVSTTTFSSPNSAVNSASGNVQNSQLAAVSEQSQVPELAQETASDTNLVIGVLRNPLPLTALKETILLERPPAKLPRLVRLSISSDNKQVTFSASTSTSLTPT